nr:DUF2920 family protein [Campylobacterota bacterium]
FSDDRFRIRNIADTTHLESMASTSKNRTKYIAYHSASDTIAPLSDKVQLYASLNELGFETNLHVIKEDSIVDEKFIKTRKHGMGMSLKRLADKELPNALDISLKKREENSEIIYPCDTLEYRFLIDGQTYIGTSKSFGKDERSVEKIAEQTYLKNIAYLEKYQPEVYEKLAAFDSALAQNLYQSKYDLVHHNDYFDVVELSTGNRLYDSNSDDYANLAMKSVNLQKDFNVYETFKKVTVKESQLEALAKLDITENNLSALAPILHYVEQHKTPSNQMQSIEKFIFLGVGLGGHIMEIDKKINAKVYLIVEDDIELFRLSLFCTPYYTLAAKSELVFSVFDTPSEFIKPASKFLESHYYYNHYLKYFHMLNHSEEKLQEFHIRVASQSHNLFFYNAILQQYLKPLSYLNQNYNFLNILKPYGDMALGNQPVILLAAGPSLQQNIEWIKVNQDKFIIVALSATLSILEKEKIKPDIVTHIDGFDESIAHFKKLDSLDFLSKTIFLMSARTPDEIIEDLPKENIFFFENGTSYKKEFGNLSAPCVGSITYLLLLAFDIKTLYLLGLDLALDNRGATHSDGHEYTKQLDLKNIDTHEDTLVYKNSVLKVAGNFQEEVFTTPDFKTSIDSINATSVGFKKENQYIYNLSNGALFENSIATPVEQCDLSSAPMIAKEKLYKEMHKDFTHNSDMHLTKDEFLLLQQRYAHAQFVKETILTQQKRYFHTSEDFLNSLTTLLSKIASSISVVQYDLALVYQEYCRFIYTFIFDFFNTQELPSNEKYMNDLNALLSEQLLRIVNKYEQELHTIVKVQEK